MNAAAILFGQQIPYAAAPRTADTAIKAMGDSLRLNTGRKP